MGIALKRLLIGFVVLVLLAALGLYLGRLPLLEWGVKGYLRDRGVMPVALEALALSPSELVIGNVSLGDDELSLDLIHLSYRSAEILAGRVRQVFIDGLDLKADLTGGGPVLGSLQGLLEADDDAADAGAPAPLPTVTIQNSMVRAELPFGPGQALIEGEIWADEAAAPQGAISFDATSEVGDLKGLLAIAGGAGGQVVGNLIIDGGNLSLPEASAAGISGGGGFALRGGKVDSLDIELALVDLVLHGEGVPSPPFDSATVSAAVEGEDAQFVLEMAEADGGLSLQLYGEAADYRGTPDVELAGLVELPAKSRLWEALGLPVPDSGALRFDLEASGEVADPEGLFAAAAADPWRLAETGLNFVVELGAGDLTLAPYASGVDAQARLSGGFDDEGLDLTLHEAARLEIETAGPKLLDALGVGPDIADLLRGLVIETAGDRPLDVRLIPEADGLGLSLDGAVSLANTDGSRASLQGTAGLGLARAGTLQEVRESRFYLALTDLVWQGYELRDGRLSGGLTGPLDALKGRLEGRIALPQLDAGPAFTRDIQATLTADVSSVPGRLDLAFVAPGEVTAEALTLADKLAIQQPLAIRLEAGELSLARDGESYSLRHSLSLAGAANSLSWADKDEAPLRIDLVPGPLVLEGSMTPELGYALQGRLAATEVKLPDYDLAASGVSAKFDFNTALAALGASFEVAALSDVAVAKRFHPLAITGQLSQQSGEAVHLTARGGWPAAPDNLRLEAVLDPQAGKGSAAIDLGALAFAEGGLQPAQISPLADELTRVSGSVSAKARLGWSADGLDSKGGLTLTGLAFTSQDTRVEGLDLDLDLESLLPPVSAPDQWLRIETLDPGMPVEQLALRFRLPAGELPRVQLEEGSFTALGGEFGIEPTMIGSSGDQVDVTIEIRSLALADLLETIEMAGVTGEGTLDGKIPLRLEGESFAIAGGELTARTPGRVKFRSEEAQSVLGQQDENVDNMLAALEDFRYEELSMTLDKTAEQDLTLRLSILGNNPAVLDGQAFRININLESNIDNILKALSEGLAISSERIRRLWQDVRQR